MKLKTLDEVTSFAPDLQEDVVDPLESASSAASELSREISGLDEKQRKRLAEFDELLGDIAKAVEDDDKVPNATMLKVQDLTSRLANMSLEFPSAGEHITVSAADVKDDIDTALYNLRRWADL